MREVAVHLEHQLGVAGQRPAEAGEVCRPEPFLHLAMEHADVIELGGEPIGELAGPVRRVVVDDEYAHVLFSERPQHRLEVLALVVGGEANDGSRHLRIFN